MFDYFFEEKKNDVLIFVRSEKAKAEHLATSK